MSSKALAIKWRPSTFSEVVGQDHVVKALANSLNGDRLHHAWLLTGTRGIGKTTIARLMAKSLNCLNRGGHEPCNACTSCLQIGVGRAPDVIELDAASHTQVDNMRELLENALYAPTSLKFKIYIIDEVHMLSKSAFNAMLKTLEEPPPHVKFILATTDPHKIPVTVLSRCLQFNLKKLPPNKIKDKLSVILRGENIDFSENALYEIASAASGSMRDALSITDQAILLGDGRIEEKSVREMLGSIEKTQLYAIIDALGEKKGNLLIEAANDLADLGVSLDKGLLVLSKMIHRMSLLKAIPDCLDKDSTHDEKLKKLSEKFTPEDLQLMYQVTIHGMKDFEWAPDEFAGFSMVLLRMLAFAPAQSIYSVKEKKTKTKILEKKGAETKPRQPLPDDWRSYLKKLKVGGMASMLANNCELISVTEKSLKFLVPKSFENLINPQYISRLQAALKEDLGIFLKLHFEISDHAKTPASHEADSSKKKYDAALESLKHDQFVSDLLSDFDAKIIQSSVKPIDNYPKE